MSQISFRCHHRFTSGFELNLSFEVVDQVTSLFGPSGSGKTSVLGVIAGLWKPDFGRITLGTKLLLDTRRGIYVAAEQRDIGLVFQDHLLFPHMTVEANLRYGQRRQREVQPIDFGRVVKTLEVENLLRRYPRNLSGGERQRIALGRALLSSPDLLLMDEPVASLDEALKLRILVYLERVVTEWRIPTLFVSHGQAEVRRLAERVIVIQKGKVVAEGRPDEALGQPAPLGWTKSVGPVNLLKIEELRLRENQWIGRVGGQEFNLPAFNGVPTRPIFVQFWPSDVTLSLQDVGGLSTRNHLRGIVRQLVELVGGVFVAVDVGQILWAEVTEDAVRELNLKPGSIITCLVKSRSLQIVN